MSEKPYGVELAGYKIERAVEELDTAKLLLENGKWRAANNRAYYSICYAITAVICLEPIAFHKHKDTLAYFNKNYVHTEKFERTLGRRISKAEKIRHASDYDEFYIASKEETVEQINTAELVISEVRKFIKIK